MSIASVNPATEETMRSFEPHSAAQVEKRLAIGTFGSIYRASNADGGPAC